MRVLTKQDIINVERDVMARYAVPELLMIEHVAIQAADYITQQYNRRSVGVCCGGGNNGADGYALARILHTRGVDVVAYAVSDKRGDMCDTMHNMAHALGIVCAQIDDILRRDVIVDAMTGYGFRTPLQKELHKSIVHINDTATHKPVIALDMPSGVCCDTGAVDDVAVRATDTLTVYYPKYSAYAAPANAYYGNVTVLSPPIPYDALERDGALDHAPLLLDCSTVAQMLPRDDVNLHKGTRRLAVIGGSAQYTGAPLLSASAAMHSGAGYVTLCVPRCIADGVRHVVPECVVVPCEDDGGCIVDQDTLVHIANRHGAAAFGMGLGLSDVGRALLERLITQCEVPLILDGDALTLLARDVSVLYDAKCAILVTPHAMECARLTGYALEYVMANRIQVASELAKTYTITVVLKGANTVIAHRDGVYVNTTGNSGMATAGSGDVLAGVVGAYACAVPPHDAAAAAAYIHSFAGDLLRRTRPHYLATDLVNMLSSAEQQLMSHKP